MSNRIRGKKTRLVLYNLMRNNPLSRSYCLIRNIYNRVVLSSFGQTNKLTLSFNHQLHITIAISSSSYMFISYLKYGYNMWQLGSKKNKKKLQKNRRPEYTSVFLFAFTYVGINLDYVDLKRILQEAGNKPPREESKLKQF